MPLIVYTMKSRYLLKNFAVFFVAVLGASILAVDATGQTGAPKQEKLLNGLKVLMWPERTTDKVSVSVRIHSGSAFDPQGKEGVMHLLASNIFPNEATKDYFAEDLGGSLEIITTYDFIEIRTSALSEHFLAMLETVSTAVANPSIDKETTQRLKTQMLARIAELHTDPAYLADRAAAQRLFGTFPYGRPPMGTSVSLDKIDFADLIEARQKFFTADNATIAVSGNFDRALGFRAIRRYFGSWLKSDRKIPSTFKQPDPPPAETMLVKSPQKGKTAVRFAFRGPARSDKDHAASHVFAALIKARLASRLPEVHGEDVLVKTNAHVLPGSIVIGFAAGENEIGEAPGKVTPGVLIERSLTDPITDVEFRTAIAAAKAEWNKRDVRSFWLDADTYQIAKPEADIKAIDSVTLADVRAFADRASSMPRASVFLKSPQESN